MAIRALPILCILFLLCTSPIVLPSTEAARTLEENKAEISSRPLVKRGIRYPNPGSPQTGRQGQPYTQPCRSRYHCPPGGKP